MSNSKRTMARTGSYAKILALAGLMNVLPFNAEAKEKSSALPEDKVEWTDSTQLYMDTLYIELKKGYSAGKRKASAQKMADKAFMKYMSFLNVGKTDEAQAYLQQLWENEFEPNRIAAARDSAYTVRKDDPESLVTSKNVARAAYNDCTAAEKADANLKTKFDNTKEAEEKAFAEEVERQKAAAIERGEDTLNLPEMVYEPSENLLKIDLSRSVARKDFAIKQLTLVRNDAILYREQLKKDLSDAKKRKKMLEENIADWDRLEKEIRKLDERIRKEAAIKDNTPGDLNKEKKHDKKLVTQENVTAEENLARKQLLIQLRQEKAVLEAAQKEYGSREELVAKLNETKAKISEFEGILKQISRGKNVERPEFIVVEYKDSKLKEVSDKVEKGYAPKREDEVATVDYSAVSNLPVEEAPVVTAPVKAKKKTFEENIADIKAKYASQKDIVIKEDSTLNGYRQTQYIHKDGEIDFIMEYPNGKVAVWTSEETVVYSPNGDVSRYVNEGTKVTEYKNDKQVTDSKCTNTVEVLKILESYKHQERH